LDLIQHLRQSGYAVEYSLTPAKSDKQFQRALELKARFTVKLERSEEQEVVVKLKNLATRQEKTVVPPPRTGPAD
jgi:histidyl-tRNA synthetase